MGARIVTEAGRRFQWPDEVTEAVATLTRHHLRAHQAADMSDAGIRRYVRDAGEAGWQRLGDLTRADCTTRHIDRLAAAVARVDRLEQAIVDLERRGSRQKVRGPMDGHSIMGRYGIGPGPQLGRAVAAVVEAAREAWDCGGELDEASAWLLVEAKLGPPPT